MKLLHLPILLFSMMFVLASCVSKKEFSKMEDAYQTDLALANEKLNACESNFVNETKRLAICRREKEKLQGNLDLANNNLSLRQEQMEDLREQLRDAKFQRDQQVSQVGDLTDLSKSASENIKETLAQLEGKDKYIRFLQAAKSKADSINLALAVNLKSVLKEGIEDNDIEIKVDKTVVFINLSDKMLYQSGSFALTTRAHEVLKKIATIIESRPELEVMVEGYTDNVPIKNSCMEDNWDLSVKRATSVVRVLQKNYGIDPNRLVAAGRGEYNILMPNDTAAGRSINRRTRIIILPKLAQFYDLLNPVNLPN